MLKSFLWDEENRLLAVNNNGSVSCYFYDAAGERTVKLTSESEMVHVNGKKVGGNANICKFTAYVSPYFVVSNGGAYTKHIYAASQRIASKLGNEDGFGADPRRVEQAGGKKISDFQKGNVGERFKALGYEYSAPEKEKVEKDSTMDLEAEEKLIFFYHPDHLGSTSYVTDADGNIAQHVEYIPYGEVFVEERNSQFSTNFLFNAKELDNETGLYYYGARYLDPTGAMWLSVDPLYEKNISATPYNYCFGNPLKYIDPNGEDSIAVLIAPNGADMGIYKAGHMACLIQDKDHKWRLYSKNGTTQNGGVSGANDVGNDMGTTKPGSKEGYDTVEDFLKCDINNKRNPKYDNQREYSEAYVIDTKNEENNRRAETAIMEMLKEDYNLATSNCSETVQAGLSAAGLDDGSLGFWKTYLT